MRSSTLGVLPTERASAGDEEPGLLCRSPLLLAVRREVKPHASTQVRAIHATHPPVPSGTETPATCTLGSALRPAPHVRPCQPCTQRNPDGAQRCDLHRPCSRPAKSPANGADTRRRRITTPPIDTGHVTRAKPRDPISTHRHTSDQAAAVRCIGRSWITVLEGA